MQMLLCIPEPWAICGNRERVPACAGALFAQNNSYVLKAARLFDSTSGQLVTPGVVGFRTA
jgi:hypothetical protein